MFIKKFFYFCGNDRYFILNEYEKEKHRGFSFVEILVILGVIGILLGILLPMIQLARESLRRQTCVNHLRQLASAVQSYHDSNNSFPLLGCYSAGADLVGGDMNVKYDYPRINSIVAMLPYLGEPELSQKLFKLRKDKGDTVARRTENVPEMGYEYQLPFLLCPSDTVPNMDGEVQPERFTPIAARSYAFCCGDFPDTGIQHYIYKGGGVINDEIIQNFDSYNKNTRTAIPSFRDYRNINYIKDGLSKTMLFGEMTRGSDQNLQFIRTSVRLDSIMSSYDFPLGENPGPECISQKWRSKDPNKWDETVRVTTLFGGIRAYDGITTYSTFASILPPNSPNCMFFFDERPMFSISSYHSGGANVVNYDGSVLFVNNNINCITEGVTNPVIKDKGRSDYGVWGSMGAVNDETAENDGL